MFNELPRSPVFQPRTEGDQKGRYSCQARGVEREGQGQACQVTAVPEARAKHWSAIYEPAASTLSISTLPPSI